MCVLEILKRPFCCCSKVHHLPRAVGSYVIGQEIYNICVTEKLVKIQIFQHLTLRHSKCLRNNQWNCITSQNCFPINTASYPRITSSMTVLHHKTTPWWHSVTHPVTQHHIPAEINCQKHCCETLRQLVFVCDIWIIHFWLNFWRLKSTQHSL